MTRTRSIIAVVLGAAAWAAVAACNQQTINTPIRSFDRPSDVALACVQYDPTAYDKDLRPHGTYFVRPISDCEPVRANELAITVPAGYGLPIDYVPPLGPANFIPFLVALVPQSARGELALVDAAPGKLVDLDPYTPGFGFLPVGKLPEHVRASKDGCWAVTANSDSCDLSRIDVSTVIHSSLISFFPSELSQGIVAANGVRQLPLTVPAATAGAPPKQLYARPGWIEMAPETDEGASPAAIGDKNSATPGFCIGGEHHAWVALPGCQLVVKVKLENAPDPTSSQMPQPTIMRALHVDKSGVTEVTDLSTLECPVECAGAIGSGGTADLGAPVTPTPTDMGSVNLPSTQAWPTTLAVDTETGLSNGSKAGRLAIGDGYGERIDILPFDIATGKLGTATSVNLDPGDNGLQQPGVSVVRIGPRSEAGKFLYAVARDGTVRVIDLDRNAECETNPDPRADHFQDSWTLNASGLPTNIPPPRSVGCFPVGDPATPPRSPFATSPGISLVPGEVPTDVAFVHVDAPPGDPTQTVAPPPASPGLLVGDFAWILTSDGKGTLVNIYDACPQPNQQASTAQSGQYTAACIPGNIAQSLADTVKQFGHPQPILFELLSHQLRAGHPRFFNPATESDVTGQPRVPDSTNPCAVAVPPTSPGLPDGGVPDAGACGSTSGNLPSLYRELVPQSLSPAPQETRVVYFVDPTHVRNETWVLTWEGVLAGTDRATGAPIVVPANYPPGMGADHNRAFLSDPGGSWCGRGARAGDKLIFRGCTTDSECDQAGGFQCVHDPGAFPDVSQGMCLHIDTGQFTVDYWTQNCGKLLRSQRKYRVLSAKQGAPVPQYPTDPGNPPPATTPPASSLTDLLELAEAYEPEFAEQTHTCTTTADCDDVKITTQVGGMTRATSCLADVDGQKRCLATCADPAKDDDCGADFECAQSAFGDNRCMRAPIGDAGAGHTFWQLCMPELQQYELHAGDQFTVSGTSSGFLSNETTAADGECIVPPQTLERVRLFQWRVPLSAPTCPDNVNANPLTSSIDPKGLASNVCLVNGPVKVGATSEVIHFENPVFNIGLTVPLVAPPATATQMMPIPRPVVPPDGTSVSMAVTGGGNGLQALLGVDVQAQQPRYATVGPDGQTVYVIDEGKAAVATGLRGQLLRLFSSSQSVDTTFVVR